MKDKETFQFKNESTSILKNKLPQGWDIKSLGELCEIKPPKKEAKEKLTDNDLVTFLPMEDLGISTKDFITVKERKLKEVVGSYTYFAENDVLLAKITPCFENGKIGIARNLTNGIGFGSSEYLVFRSKGEIIPEYLFYFLSRESFRIEGKKLMKGAVGHKRVSKEFIENYPLPFPKSSQEQKIITIRIDDAFVSIANAKISAEQNLKNAKELFESYLQNVFTNKGKGWVKQRFDEVCVLQRGFDLPTRLRNDGIFPLVSSNGITDRINLCKVKAPGVVTGRSGTIGNVHFIDEDFWPLNTALYIKDFHGNYERFIYYFLKQFNLDKYSSGAGVPTLNRNNVHSEIVWIPESITEQKNIVCKLDSLTIEIKKLESIYQKKVIALDELKKSILQKAFSGHL